MRITTRLLVNKEKNEKKKLNKQENLVLAIKNNKREIVHKRVDTVEVAIEFCKELCKEEAEGELTGGKESSVLKSKVNKTLAKLRQKKAVG